MSESTPVNSVFDAGVNPSREAVSKLKLLDKVHTNYLPCYVCERDSITAVEVVAQDLSKDRFNQVTICPNCIKELNRLLSAYEPSQVEKV